MEGKEEIAVVSVTKKTPLREVLELGCGCNKDGKCCEFGGGFVIHDDIPRISSHLGITENQFKAKYLDPVVRFNTQSFKLKSHKRGKQYGPCVFLSGEKQCSVQKVKPLHCKIGTCSEHGESISHWFTLNYYVNAEDPQSIREWAIYLKNHDTIPGGALEELVPNKQRLKDILEYKILK
jgi:Fe-S-cluster containining protein